MVPRLSLPLLFCLLLLSGLAEAQLPWLPFRHPQSARRFVTTVTYQGQTLLLKRTPTAKLPRTGGQAIVALETQLAACYQALPTSDTARVLRLAQSDSLFRALTLVGDHYPRWNTVAYEQEVRFYQRTQVQRQLHRLWRQFTQAQHQLDSLRTRTQAWAARALFQQAAQAGQAAEKAQQWVQAEVYLARCLALRPTDATMRARHAAVSEQCLRQYFARFVRASQRVRGQVSGSATRPLRREPGYCTAESQAAYYLGGTSADYTALTLGGQPAYLYQQVEIYELARELLSCRQVSSYAQQAEELLQAYGQCYGYDRHWRSNRQLLLATQQLHRTYDD